MNDPTYPPLEPGPLDAMRGDTDPQDVRALPAPVLWAVIILSTVALMGLVLVEQRSTPPPADPASGNLIVEMQSRLIFALHEITPVRQDPNDLQDQLAELRNASSRPGVAWRIAALEMAVTANHETALDHVLDELNIVEPDPTDQATTDMHQLVLRAVQDPDSLTANDKSRLVDELGWAGNLLAAGDARDTDPHWQTARSAAIKTLVILVVAFCSFLLAGFVGSVLLIIVGIKMAGSAPTFCFKQLATSVHQNVYLEAFAIYLTLMLLAAVAVLVMAAGQTAAQSAMFPVSLAALSIASILGVIWPTWRGARWHDVRQDLGLHSGRGVFTEVLCGIVGYITVLPLFGVGIVLTFFFLIVDGVIQRMIQSHGSPPNEAVGQPIFEMLANPSLGAILGVFFLASVFAPFFEETLFRGALLNGCFKRPGVVGGLFIMGFIFAAIHPQGIVAIPALMSLGIGFGLIRMWRGSLIASMVAHGLHNGLLLTFVLLALS